MKALRHALGLGVALLATAGLVRLSALPAAQPQGGMLRLSWRALGAHVEKCRKPSEAELAALPQHMRQQEICERRLAPFALAVFVDGSPRIAREVQPAGARGDRPATVFEQIELAPGRHRIEASFRSAAETLGAAAPLRWEGEIELARGDVALLTRDDASGELVLLRAPR